MSDALTELRQYRDLRRRRDPLIRRAAREGASRRQIASAAGVHVQTVRRILGKQNVAP